MNSDKQIVNNLIAFCGRKRVGKDVATGCLIKEYGFEQYAFANPLKLACQEIFMLNEEQMDGCLKEVVDPEWGVSPRHLFQRIGTEIFRNQITKVFPEMEEIGNNFWVYRFKLWYKKQLEKNPNIRVVLSDVRFQNEADVVKELGGIVIKIQRDTKLNTDSHASEKNIDNIKTDYIIENNGTIEQYHEKVKKLIEN
jgi:hypothetical protein